MAVILTNSVIKNAVHYGTNRPDAAALSDEKEPAPWFTPGRAFLFPVTGMAFRIQPGIIRTFFILKKWGVSFQVFFFKMGGKFSGMKSFTKPATVRILT